MTCAVCTKPGNEAKRLEWGCDGPTAKMPLRLFCWFCEGKDKDCTHCRGTGEIYLKRCPNALVQPEHWDAVLASSLLEVGLTPTGCGWADMPASGMHAMGIVTRERERLRELNRG